MKMAEKGPGMVTLRFTSIIVFAVLLGQGSPEKTGEHRLSGFLYNISLYLQEMGAELEEAPAQLEEEQLWEKVLHFFLQSEGSATLNQWNGRVPPRPSVKVQDWFLSLRGSPHWDWLLGLLQSLITLSERQAHKPLLSFLSQNWRTVSAVLDAALQALVSLTYGQASAGLQGFICALKGRSDCAFSINWLQQLLHFLETRNWKPALSPLVQSLDGLRRGLLQRVGSSVYGNLRKKVSRVTMALLDDVSSLVDVPQSSAQGQCSVGEFVELGIRHNVTWNTQALGVSSEGLPSSLPFLSCPSTSEGDELRSQQTSVSPKAGPSSQTISKQKRLHELSTAPHRSQLNQPQTRRTSESNDQQKEMAYATSTEILEAACNESIPGLTGSPGLDENCLAQLGNSSLSAQAFRHCFLPNNSVLISSLCGTESPESHRSLSEGSWATAYCSKILNFSQVDTTQWACQYRSWAAHDFTNTTLIELCGQAHGLQEYICLNATLYNQLSTSMPQFAEFCADLQAELDSRKCFLQRIFDMLPAPYQLDTSQLCMDPAPLLVDILHKLSVCEVEGGEHERFLAALGYVLRVLDFMVGLSSGLDEGEREARQGLGQAILLSSLLDNTSWATLHPEASTSILHTVGVFLRREQNASLKEDLLSCFSVSQLTDTFTHKHANTQRVKSE
uniref:Stereocilin LRR domain-containing protein n=1 Tax=Mastacembelus armatus TaxID=205130 RepID=A0A3Q3SUM9_9TELE